MLRLRKTFVSTIWTSASVAHTVGSGGHRWFNTSNTLTTDSATWPTGSQHMITLSPNVDLLLVSALVTGISETHTNTAAANNSLFKVMGLGIPRIGQTGQDATTGNAWYTQAAQTNINNAPTFGIPLLASSGAPLTAGTNVGTFQGIGYNLGNDVSFGCAPWTPWRDATNVDSWALGTAQTYQVHVWLSLARMFGGTNAFGADQHYSVSDVCSHVVLGVKGVDASNGGPASGTVTFSGEVRVTGYQCAELGR